MLVIPVASQIRLGLRSDFLGHSRRTYLEICEGIILFSACALFIYEVLTTLLVWSNGQYECTCVHLIKSEISDIWLVFGVVIRKMFAKTILEIFAELGHNMINNTVIR